METVGERYVLVELLSADEKHEVWRGHDDLAGRQVVITRFLETSAEWRVAFARRARQLQALADPGIASILAHDATADPPWLVAAFVDGETAAMVAADPGLSPDDALAVIGQTALALATMQGAGVGHGRLDGEHIQVRPDGSIALISFVVDRSPSPAEDLVALGALARELLDEEARKTPDVATFLGLLAAGDWGDPGDIGRTALALAAAQRAGGTMRVHPTAEEADESEEETDPEPPRPWYDEDERKRVRNRLIALGAIVVIGGVVLLRIFGSGAGQTSVPNVIGVPYVQALHDLNEQGLRGNETITTGPVGSEGTVIAQDPSAGQQEKVGSVVDLTVAAVGG